MTERKIRFKLHDYQLNNLIKKRNITILGLVNNINDLALLLNSDMSIFSNNDDEKNINSIEYQFTRKNIRDAARKIYGCNKIDNDVTISFLKILFRCFCDKTLLLLILAGILSLLIGMYRMKVEDEKLSWIEGTAILLAVLCIVIISSVNEYTQKKTFKDLNLQTKVQKTKIFSHKKYDTVDSHELVVGDIIYLEPGDMIPADCIMIFENDHIVCDESQISGESEPIYKSKNDLFLLSGSYITEGATKALVICTGKNSIKGNIIQQIQNSNQKTPLENKIDDLVQKLAVSAFYLAFFLLISQSIKILLTNQRLTVHIFSKIIIESISIIVMAVPEGLPMAITLALSFSTRKLMKEKILVKELSACETMNNVNVICTDKTGTLTLNKMTIKLLLVGNEILTVNTTISPFACDFIKKLQNYKDAMELTILNFVINSSAFENSQNEFIGNRNEIALLELLKNDSIDYEEIRSQYTVVQRKAFSSTDKYMATMVKQKNGKFLVLFKGAPEIILKNCLFKSDEEILNHPKNGIDHEFSNISDQKCYRTMAFSYVTLDEHDSNAVIHGFHPTNFLCAIAMEDPLRSNVQKKIKLCKKAGIEIVILTGDKIEMATYMAKKLDILSDSCICLTGPQFRDFKDKDLIGVLHRIRIIARADSDDKKRFVQLLQKEGSIVAVTGDGTNDAPAMKAADVGFCMGISGTDITKQASSIILTNDDFNSIINCIEWGRCINYSVRKFLQYQISTTVTTVVSAIVSSLLSSNGYGLFTPLKLLWVNVVLDTLAPLGLSTDQPNKELLNRNPESQDSPLINESMIAFILFTSFYQLIIVILISFVGCEVDFIYNIMIYLSLFNQINARSINPYHSPFERIHENTYFIGTIIITIIAQFIIMQYLGFFMDTKPLNLNQWIVSVFVGSSIIPFMILVRFIQRKRADKQSEGWSILVKKLEKDILIDNLVRNLGKTPV